MSKEKQIEEMAKDIEDTCENKGCNEYRDCSKCRAEWLYELGYRKQSEGEWTKHLDEYDCEYAKCSHCGEEYYDANGEDTIDMFYKYCPNCGARMKGGA
jgi:DNA-directed RNA polymerase subunit RPC12/RpoP